MITTKETDVIHLTKQSKALNFHAAQCTSNCPEKEIDFSHFELHANKLKNSEYDAVSIFVLLKPAKLGSGNFKSLYHPNIP